MSYNTLTTPVDAKAWALVAVTRQNAILQNVTPSSEGIEVFVGAAAPSGSQRGIVLSGRNVSGENSITLDDLGTDKIYVRAVRTASELVALEY